MDVYEGKCTCGDADCARVLVIEPVFRVSIVDETDELAVTEIMTRDQLLDWVFSDDDCVIQNAINELSIEPDGTSVWQWLDGAEDAALRRQLAEIRRALGAPDNMPNNEVTEVASGMAELLMECLGDNMPVAGEGE